MDTKQPIRCDWCGEVLKKKCVVRTDIRHRHSAVQICKTCAAEDCRAKHRMTSDEARQVSYQQWNGMDREWDER